MVNVADGKAEFFEHLYALSQISDDEDEVDKARMVPRVEVSSTISVAATTPAVTQNSPKMSSLAMRTPNLQRASTEPSPRSGSVIKDASLLYSSAQLHYTKTRTPLAKETSMAQETPIASRLQPGRRDQIRTMSAPSSLVKSKMSLQTMNVKSSGGRKRKRSSLQLKPVEEQFFRGYTFFYIPNDDIAPARRTRIMRAREYGVDWTKVWSNAVTHVVVDKGLSYKDAMSFLKIPALPKNMTMVVDHYPIECIQFRAVLDPTQNQYLVKGYPSSSGGSSPLPQVQPSQTSNTSLKLKPKHSKWDYIPPQSTPSRSEDGSLRSAQFLDISMATGTDNARPPGDEISFQIEVSNSQGKVVDEMDAAIVEMQNSKDLPLDNDDDDDDDERPSSRDSVISDESNDNSTSPTLKPHSVLDRRKSTSGQQYFTCMKGGSGLDSLSNPNSHTISLLQEMADHYAKTEQESWRAQAYRKVITILKQQTTRITTAEEARQLPGVGKRLADKIQEIATTSSLRRLESAKSDPSDQILQRFMSIYQVGYSQASKWLAKGYKSLEDLKTHVHLTENQLIGIEHYHDFLTPIPRDEVSALGDFVKRAAFEIDPTVEMIIGGSYRRGSSSSGDIDFIATKRGTTRSQEIFEFLRLLVSKLTTIKFLVAALSVSHTDEGSKWHGCCVLPDQEKPIWRRIDFLIVPGSQLGAALIYFTGNDIFNRSIRLLASRKGMRLNQRGLYKDVMRGPGRQKMNEGALVEGANERKIFATLGVPWRPPEQRIC